MLKKTGVESPQTSPKASYAVPTDTKSDLVRIGVIGYGYWDPTSFEIFTARKDHKLLLFVIAVRKR